MNTNQQSQLFTELTPSEGAAVSGGAYLYIDKIQAIKADADTWSKDDTYITVNGHKIWGNYGMGSGQKRDVRRWKRFNSSARIELFDSDWGSDDNLGGFSVAKKSTNGLARKRVRGSGSTYDVYYRVYA